MTTLFKKIFRYNKKQKMAKQISKPYGDGTNASINIISEGTKIKGDIIANGDIRIDGELLGNISAQGRLVIGPTGKIEGEITCNNIEISGHIKGKLIAKELLTMKSSSKIEGDITAGKLSVEPGSEFTGTCSMGSTSSINETAEVK